MKFALGAVALLMIAAPALAQTAPAAPAAPPATACPPMPPSPPALPADGATAKQSEMVKGQDAFNAWIAVARPAVECRQNEVKAMNAKLLEMQAQVKARADLYNPDVGAYNSVVDKWRGVVETYQASSAAKKKR